MLLAIENLPVSSEVVSTYNYFHLKHNWSPESLHALVLNDVAMEQSIAQAGTDLEFGLITKEAFVATVNKAVTDRNSLRSMVDTKVEFTDEEKETTERDYQRILLTQIHGYLNTGKQVLADEGIIHTVSPGIGLDIGI